MTIVFFPFFLKRWGGGGILAGKNRWIEQGGKMSRLKSNIRKSTGLDKMLVPQKEKKKLWNLPSCSLHLQTTPTPSLTHTHLSILNWDGFYLSHFISGREDAGQFTFQKRFVEKLIQQTTLLYQPVTILETACILCIALFESDIVIKADNKTKWCLRVAGLKLRAAIYSLINISLRLLLIYKLFDSKSTTVVRKVNISSALV